MDDVMRISRCANGGNGLYFRSVFCRGQDSGPTEGVANHDLGRFIVCAHKVNGMGQIFDVR